MQTWGTCPPCHGLTFPTLQYASVEKHGGEASRSGAIVAWARFRLRANWLRSEMGSEDTVDSRAAAKRMDQSISQTRCLRAFPHLLFVLRP